MTHRNPLDLSTSPPTTPLDCGEPTEIDDLLDASHEWAYTHGVARPTPTTVLLSAADLLDALPHLRVDVVDVHRALRQAAEALLPDRDAAYATYVDAVELLTYHLAEAGVDARWVRDYGAPISRDVAAAQLRAAATQAGLVTA